MINFSHLSSEAHNQHKSVNLLLDTMKLISFSTDILREYATKLSRALYLSPTLIDEINCFDNYILHAEHYTIQQMS